MPTDEDVAHDVGDRLAHLEARVQSACEAIYRDNEGYWPNDAERHRIARVLLSAVDLGDAVLVPKDVLSDLTGHISRLQNRLHRVRSSRARWQERAHAAEKAPRQSASSTPEEPS